MKFISLSFSLSLSLSLNFSLSSSYCERLGFSNGLGFIVECMNKGFTLFKLNLLTKNQCVLGFR